MVYESKEKADIAIGEILDIFEKYKLSRMEIIYLCAIIQKITLKDDQDHKGMSEAHNKKNRT